MPPKKDCFVEILHDTGTTVSSLEQYQCKWNNIMVGSENDQSYRHIIWAWEEDSGCEKDHSPALCLLGKSPYVKYKVKQSRQIEAMYQGYIVDKEKPAEIARNKKIPKSQQEMLIGRKYKIDFQKMVQINVSSGYERQILRLECWATNYWADMWSLHEFPDNDEMKNEPFLPTYRGQIIQIIRNTGGSLWSYGKVLYDPMLEKRPDHIQEGWFPTVLSKVASVEKLQKMRSSKIPHNISIDTDVSPPDHWTLSWNRKKFPSRVTLSRRSKEFQEVSNFFCNSLGDDDQEIYSVLSIKRIQQLTMWQSYQAMCKKIKLKYNGAMGESLDNNVHKDFEKTWLFHGTSNYAASIIARNGLKLLCAGNNGSWFGRGIYFGDTASDSLWYSTEDCLGKMSMFLCRVVVGDWCKADSGQLEPGPKPGRDDSLYDSTVDDIDDPSMYIVYNDAQVYPEYLVTFKYADPCGCFSCCQSD